jgi:hypothetical protein
LPRAESSSGVGSEGSVEPPSAVEGVVVGVVVALELG